MPVPYTITRLKTVARLWDVGAPVIPGTLHGFLDILDRRAGIVTRGACPSCSGAGSCNHKSCRARPYVGVRLRLHEERLCRKPVEPEPEVDEGFFFWIGGNL